VGVGTARAGDVLPEAEPLPPIRRMAGEGSPEPRPGPRQGGVLVSPGTSGNTAVFPKAEPPFSFPPCEMKVVPGAPPLLPFGRGFCHSIRGAVTSRRTLCWCENDPLYERRLNHEGTQ
jgi:hypothetical protein